MNDAILARLQDLESKLEACVSELQRTKAVLEIQNVMGRYSFWHTAHMHRESLDLFALETPGVRAEMVWGVYEGRESVERLYADFHPWAEVNLEGRMHMHALSTPVIEVAQDLRTAKGVWISPGHDTMSFKEGEPNRAHWVWIKYGCDFVVENGRWKIWHLHVYPVFLSPFERSWVDTAGDEFPFVLPEQFRPDRQPTTDTLWRPDRIYQNLPAPPDPFERFDEQAAY